MGFRVPFRVRLRFTIRVASILVFVSGLLQGFEWFGV